MRKPGEEKTQWSLLPFGPIQEAAEIFTEGAKKHSPNGWMTVEDWRAEYISAALRHFVAWILGEKIDPESGKPHLSRLLCNILILRSREMMEETHGS